MVAPSAIRERHVGCAVCGRWFLDDDHFDAHRIRIVERVPPHQSDMRCMTSEEMTAAQFKQTRKGLWVRVTGQQRKQRT
jgi:hypothetical protein